MEASFGAMHESRSSTSMDARARVSRRIISDSLRAADMEIFQHHSPNTDFIRREFRPHAPSPVTASGEVQASRLNSPLRSRRSWPNRVTTLWVIVSFGEVGRSRGYRGLIKNDTHWTPDTDLSRHPPRWPARARRQHAPN